MKSYTAIAIAALTLLGTAAVAMPEGSMAGDKMSAKEAKMAMKCKKMSHKKAMKNKNCAATMKPAPMNNEPMSGDAMKPDNMAPEPMKH